MAVAVAAAVAAVVMLENFGAPLITMDRLHLVIIVTEIVIIAIETVIVMALVGNISANTSWLATWPFS